MGSSTTMYLIACASHRCNNPSKWGLQQRYWTRYYYDAVVITPQNGVFNNT